MARSKLGRRPARRRRVWTVSAKRAHRTLRTVPEETSGCRSHFRRPRGAAISFPARTRNRRRHCRRQNRFRSQQSGYASRHDDSPTGWFMDLPFRQCDRRPRNENLPRHSRRRSSLEYARELSDAEFYDLAFARLKSSGVKLDKFPEKYVRAALQTCKGKINTFDELPAYCGFYFTNDVDYSPEGVSKHFSAENKPRLKAVREALSALEEFNAAEIEATLKSTASKLGGKVGAIVHPTRLAVTGSNVGPSLYHLLEVLGKERVLTRIDRALTKF